MTTATRHPPRATVGRANFTRTSDSIPRRIVREGKLHLLPLYALARTSDLAKEGMENSGSFRFADHVYRAQASGRYGVGRWIDAALLALPASRSMRERYLYSRAHIAAELRDAARRGRGARILSVPCGIARELVEAAEDVKRDMPEGLRDAKLFGLDLDPEPLALSRALAGEIPLELLQGDALVASGYPGELDLTCSTGLGEFLDDADLATFYGACFSALKPGGHFVTSGTTRSRVADRLMRELAELHVHYRGSRQLADTLRAAGFVDVEIRVDRFGLQTLVRAARPAAAA